MNLSDALQNMGQTENNAVSFNSTGSALLDFFAHAGAIRTGGDDLTRVVSLFTAAYAESRIDAVVAAFYLRDIRGGQGEREAFRLILQWLADNAPHIFIALISLIPEYGRWDDLILFASHSNVTAAVMRYIQMQLKEDNANVRNGKSVSLLGKYMQSENASSRDTKILANFLMCKLYNIDAMHHRSATIYRRKYRKMLSALRRAINIPERLMSAGRWAEIDYAAVPSRAMYIYRKAFLKHDKERFVKYLADVKSGTTKINAGVMYPYELIRRLGDNTVDLMWDALPDYFIGSARNALCVCDTSGSMMANNELPLAVALSLTLYAAERMSGFFADKAITFNAQPCFMSIPRTATLRERELVLRRGNAGYNTNFQAVFDLILTTAIAHHVPQNEMPDIIFVISDMQFDQADGSAYNAIGGNIGLMPKTNFARIKEKYALAGYTMPLFVMWNVRAASDQPVLMQEPGVFLVSGCSPVIFKQALALDISVITPYDAMMTVLHSDRLASVYEAVEGITQ